jgi:hypothetical protein
MDKIISAEEIKTRKFIKLVLIFLRLFFDKNKGICLKGRYMDTSERVEKHSLKVNWPIRKSSDYLFKSGETVR